MKPSRKIAHRIADIVLKSATNSLEPNRMRDMYLQTSTITSGPSDDAEKHNSAIVVSAWIDSIIEHMSERKDRIISDYVLDLIQSLETYLESNYTEVELAFIMESIENKYFKKMLTDDGIFESVLNAKEIFNKNVLKEMQSEECLNIMQKKLHDLMVRRHFDDNNLDSD